MTKAEKKENERIINLTQRAEREKNRSKYIQKAFANKPVTAKGLMDAIAEADKEFDSK